MSLALLQTTLDGLLQGGSYALVGLGLSLTFGGLRRLNLAYGATAMLAAYVGAWLHGTFQVPAAVVAVAMLGVAVAVGAYVEWLCFAHLEGAAAPRGPTFAGADGREVVALASSFALWMQLEQLAVNLLPRHLNAFPSLASTQEWSFGGLQLRPDRLAVALVAVAVIGAVSMGLARSRVGLAWRATADARTAAHLAGMPVEQLQRVGFAVASALSALAAFAVLALDAQVTPMFGMWVLLKGLVAALLGGLGSVRGVLWGGLLLGVVEAHAQSLLGALGREFATYALLFAMLVWPRRSVA